MDTESLFAEMDVCFATCQMNGFQSSLHQLKSSSHQAGAIQISNQAIMIDKFIHDHSANYASIAFQTRLDSHFMTLRNMFAAYRDAIQRYL